MIDIPTTLIEQLEHLGRQLTEARNECTARLDGLDRAEEALPGGACGLFTRTQLVLPTDEEFATRGHEAVIAWADSALAPGIPLTLDRYAIEGALRGRRDDVRAYRGNSFEREWLSIPLAETARHVIATYGPEARRIAGRQTADALSMVIWRRHTRVAKGSLILHAHTGVESYGIRRMSLQGIYNVSTALNAINRALVWMDAAPAGLVNASWAAMKDVFEHGFEYRRKEPHPFGHVTLFKEHVDISVASPFAEPLALFFSEFYAEDEAA
jgi:hypothetical protein